MILYWWYYKDQTNKFLFKEIHLRYDLLGFYLIALMDIYLTINSDTFLIKLIYMQELEKKLASL